MNWKFTIHSLIHSFVTSFFPSLLPSAKGSFMVWFPLDVSRPRFLAPWYIFPHCSLVLLALKGHVSALHFYLALPTSYWRCAHNSSPVIKWTNTIRRKQVLRTKNKPVRIRLASRLHLSDLWPWPVPSVWKLIQWPISGRLYLHLIGQNWRSCRVYFRRNSVCLSSHISQLHNRLRHGSWSECQDVCALHILIRYSGLTAEKRSLSTPF